MYQAPTVALVAMPSTRHPKDVRVGTVGSYFAPRLLTCCASQWARHSGNVGASLFIAPTGP